MKIGIIGTGIIAQAVVTGFCTKAPGHEFFLSPRNADRAAALASEFSEVCACSSNQEVVDRSEWVFICLHKKDFGALSELNFKLTHKVANMAAEMRLPDLKEMIGETALLAHVIPLPVIAVGIGPLLVYPKVDAVGELFEPVSEVFYANEQDEVHTLQILTGLMSAYNMLLHEIVKFSEDNGLSHDVSVKFLCSLFGALCERTKNTPDCDLVSLAHEMTPGGYNEQAMGELMNNGAISAWRTAMDGLLLRLRQK